MATTHLAPTVHVQTLPKSANPSIRPWHDLVAQMVLIGLAALLYFAVRGLTEADPAIAIQHGNNLLNIEDRLGINTETALQQHIIDRRWIVTAINWIYIWGHWPAIAGTLIWLQRTRRAEFLRLRNALFISGGIGLVIFALYPVAPPRLLGNGDLIDTVSQYSTSYRILQPPSLVNKYAALPSLHVGWNVLIGVFIWRHATRRPLRYLGAISPVLMIAAVVLTANHYIIDAAAGAAIALSGLATASALNNRWFLRTTSDSTHSAGRIQQEHGKQFNGAFVMAHGQRLNVLAKAEAETFLDTP